MAKKVKGLGDAVKVVTDALGIEQCDNCKKNQSWLNVNFPFNKPTPLTDEQKERLIPKIQKDNEYTEPDFLQVYNEAFGTNIEPEQFIGGVKTSIIKKLNKLLEYEN